MKKEKLAQDSYQYIDGMAKESGSGSGTLLRLLQSALLMDLLSCALLASGLGFAVLTLTDMEAGFFSCLGFACTATLLISVLCMKCWIAPAAAAGSAAAAGLYLGFTGRLESAATYWAGFFEWALNGAHYDKAYSESAGALLLQFTLVFATALLCYLLIRKLFSLTLICLLTGITLGGIHYLSGAEMSIPLCAAAAGIIILLPRVYARYVGRRSGGAGNRGAMQLVAVPAAFLAVILPMWILPEDTSQWKSRELNNVIMDVAYLFEGPFRSYPANASNFSMQKLGFERADGSLGGPVRLTEERFLSVTAERPVLLRGSIKDFYTGTGWQVGAADGDFRLDSLFWQSYRRGAFGWGKARGEAKRLFESLTTEQNYTINYNSGKFSTVFAGGILRDADFAKDTVLVPIYFNMRSELYLHYLVPQWSKLQVGARVWNTGTAGFEDDFLRLERLAANGGDKSFPQIRQRYTQLPDALPESVTQLARQITAEAGSPYQQVKAVENWLRETCAYTLDPVIPPENVDFVEHFLDTRQGYCTYYASAMAVLARAAGLPARYVTGFALARDENGGPLFVATGETAHAWAEIYFEGIGWVEFDPLNWNPSEPLNRAAEDLPDAQPQLVPPPPIPAESGAADEPAQNAPVRAAASLRQIIAFLAAAVSAYLVLYLAARRMMSRKLRTYELSRISRRIPDIGKRIDFYFDDIFKQLSLFGIEPHAGETLTDFSARADRRVRLDGKSFADIAKTRMRLHFANAAPTDEDCEAVFRYHHELELLLRENLRKTAYFFKRAVR